MVVICLVIAIGFISVIQWKGDAIMKSVISIVEKNLNDSLQYDFAEMEWFAYFPSVALRIDGLVLGPVEEPFLKGGHLDVVIRLWPLLKQNIVINNLLISNASVNLIRHNVRWSYEVFKKSDSASTDSWNALVHQIKLEKTIVHYDDHEDLSFMMNINTGKLDGELTGNNPDANIEIKAILEQIETPEFKLPSPVSFETSGHFTKDQVLNVQRFENWIIKLDEIHLKGNGTVRKEAGQNIMNVMITCQNGDAETIRKFIPEASIQNWEAYKIKGKIDGQFSVIGPFSKKVAPQIACNAVLKNGSIQFPGGFKLEDILLEMTYTSPDSKLKKDGAISANIKTGSFHGKSMQSDILIKNLAHPILEVQLKGTVPGQILNLFAASSGYDFKEGAFEVDHLQIMDLPLEKFSIQKWIEKSETSFSMSDLHFNYHNVAIEIRGGNMSLNSTGHILFTSDKLIWNKALAEEVEGEFNLEPEKLSYKINAKTCHGTIESIGSLSDQGQQPVMESEWKMNGVEIKEVMSSFDNFNQTFITSENIKGKAKIWAQTMIPYDATGKIMMDKIQANAAIDIADGELQKMKTLEDFSKYIHLEDLRDIRFNEFRNYLKIEGGKVYLPVVFIQSTAINLSINGVHGFDQNIYYNLKINAGQVASNKLKKVDANKNYKKSRKSGWINLYYVLSGTTSDVKYEQNQKAVISGFEQSSLLKENLRGYLVDKFGYDVYWLEPNEWEDIPEYE